MISTVRSPGSALLACGGCSLHNAQNALDVSGPQASSIAGLWWLMLPIGAVVWVLVVSVMLMGITRTRIGDQPRRPSRATMFGRRKLARVVIGAVAVTVVTLFIVLMADFRVGQRAHAAAGHEGRADQDRWTSVLVGDSSIPDSIAQNIVVTANELHIPAGKEIVLELASRDVIHSFWVPSLAGKKDLLAGVHALALVPRGHGGRVSRAVCGVLRSRAREDGAAGDRRIAGTLRCVDQGAAGAGCGAD